MMNKTEDCRGVLPPSYLSLLTIIMAAIFCLVITVGNLMIIMAVVLNPLKKLRSLFNYFVTNLALTDLIIGTISMPLVIYLHVLEYLKKKSDNLSFTFFYIFFFTSTTASVLCLITLSIDRNLAITFPLKYRSNLTWKKCWIVSFIIWSLSLGLSFAYPKTGYIDFLMIYINTAVAIAAVTFIVTFIRIHTFLQAQSQKMRVISRTISSETKMQEFKRTSQQKRVTRVFLWILLLFLACYIPAAIVVYILQFCTTCNCESIHILRDTGFYLITVNSCVNPFVYGFKNKHYRDTLTAIWKRIKINFPTSKA